MMRKAEAIAIANANPPSQASGSFPNYLKEDELTQKFRDFISSLPRQRGWIVEKIYLYQGFWLANTQLQSVLACQKQFQAQDSDILAVTMPKSGTTWLKAITFALLNRARYVDDPQKHPLLTNNPHKLVHSLELKLYVENKIPDLTTFTSPRLFSTHLLFVSLPTSVTDSASKIVYLCRNPKDTFVSLWHFTNKLRPEEKGKNTLEETFDMFCKGICGYGPFWDHALGYWKASLERPDKVIFLKYEEMKEEPTLHLRRIAEFLGCPFSPEEDTKRMVEYISKLCSFDNSSNLEVNKSGKLSTGEETKVFFRRGEIGDWMNYLTADMVERIDILVS